MITTHFRRVIHVQATDSPNVRLGLAQQRAGLPVTGETVVPGVLSWSEYQHRLQTWDEVRKCIGLYGRFYKGSVLLLFPPDWLNASEDRANSLPSTRKAEALGVDPAEGGDKTAMSVIDKFGLIELISEKTPNTDDIPKMAMDLIKRYNIPPERVGFDRGGGGKQAADYLRATGYKVRTVGFGESVSPEPRRGLETIENRKEQREERYEFKNRRAQMYWELSDAMDPSMASLGPRFVIPSRGPQYQELRRQLAVMPKLYDREGRCYMLPKNKASPDSTEKCLTDLIGHSPDEADSLVVAYHVMTHKDRRARAGGF